MRHGIAVKAEYEPLRRWESKARFLDLLPATLNAVQKIR